MAQANDKEFVTFADGWQIGFTPKKLLHKLVDFGARRVRFYFRNGVSLVVGRDDVSDDTWDRLALHGLSQKCGDEGAKETVLTADQFETAVAAMIQRLKAGTAFTREAGERIPDRDLFDAMVACGYIDEADESQVAEYRNLTTSERAALKQLDDIKAEMAEQARIRGKSVDAASLLANKFGKK